MLRLQENKSNKTRLPEKDITESEMSRSGNSFLSSSEGYNYQKDKIAGWLKKVRFHKKVFGGVSEQDVWKKINELNTMYEDALKAERIRYDVLIDHYRESCTKDIDNSTIQEKDIKAREKISDE